MNPFIPLNNRAIVLVVCMWMMAILSVFGLGLSRITRSAVVYMKWEKDRTYSDIAIGEFSAWIKNEFLRAEEEYLAYPFVSKDKEYKCGEYSVKYDIVDECSKINADKAKSKYYERLPGMNGDKATEIYTSSLKPFSALEQLLRIDEIDIKLFDVIKPFLTVHGDGWVNVNTCPEEVLLALGIDKSVADRIIEYRNGDDGEEGTSDDAFFNSTQAILDNLKVKSYLSVKDEDVLFTLISQNALNVRSNCIQVSAGVFSKNKLIAKYAFTIKRNTFKKTAKIAEWRES